MSESAGGQLVGILGGGQLGRMLAIAGAFGAWFGGKLDDRLGPKRVVAGSLLVLLLSVAAILLVDKDSVLFVKVAPPQPGAGLDSGREGFFRRAAARQTRHAAPARYRIGGSRARPPLGQPRRP